MALWNSAATWSSGSQWGPAVPPPSPVSYTQPSKTNTTMKRTYYYPAIVSEQPAWHFNYAEQLEALGVGMGLALADVTASVNDSKQVGYAIGAWLGAVREFGPGATGQVEVLKYGTGTVAFVLPELAPPAPPAGLTAVLPGALARIFRFVKMIKGAPGYTVGKGLLLGVVGSEIPPPPPGPSPAPPRITLKVQLGLEHDDVSVKFVKEGHEYIILESRRGPGGVWETLGMYPKSPILDSRALLVPGQAEIREYRARFYDNGQPNGDWCDVAKITVSP